jgi:hypothetical protein
MRSAKNATCILFPSPCPALTGVTNRRHIEGIHYPQLNAALGELANENMQEITRMARRSRRAGLSAIGWGLGA